MDKSLVIRKARSLESDYPAHWPPREFYHDQREITDQQLALLRSLVESNAGEKAIDAFLRETPVALLAALRIYSTGHHGTWVLPQQMIRPRIGSSQYGLIPDYIIGGKSSEGFGWWVAELKGADAKLFHHKGHEIKFSSTLNRGICQLLAYISYCSEMQSMLRGAFRLTGFGVPRGVIFIGREQELSDDEQKRTIKAALNRAARSSFEVHTYDSLLRAFEQVHRSSHVG